MTVSQTVVACPDGVAETIVGEVAGTVTCTEYAVGQSGFTQFAEPEIPVIDSADASTPGACGRTGSATSAIRSSPRRTS